MYATFTHEVTHTQTSIINMRKREIRSRKFLRKFLHLLTFYCLYFRVEFRFALCYEIKERSSNLYG